MTSGQSQQNLVIKQIIFGRVPKHDPSGAASGDTGQRVRREHGCLASVMPLLLIH